MGSPDLHLLPLVAVLLQRVPAFEKRHRLECEELHDLPYMVYGLFGAWLRDQLDAGSSDDSTLQAAFALLNQLAASTDREVANLAVVGVLEVLADSGRAASVAKTMLVGQAREELDRTLTHFGTVVPPSPP